jgi:uncharacterized lipoprotein YddW (UPF0748 family)
MFLMIRSMLQRWQLRFKALFLACFLLAFWLTLVLGQVRAAAQFAQPEIRGVWLTTNDTETLYDQAKLGTAINELARLNFNTIYPVVWNSGYVKFPSAVAQAEGIQAFVPKGTQGQDILADLIAKAHQQGLMVVAWFEFGFMAPMGSELTDKHPQWLTQARDGRKTWDGVAGEVGLLNPFYPEVQQFMTDLLVELVTRYDVDGVQFDDHMSLPNEFGYDPYTVALYKKATKKVPPVDYQNPGWVKWRADQLTAFMEKLNKTLKANKPGLYFSVSPNYYDYAYKAHLQDWVTWIKKGIVDELIVQVYRNDFNEFVSQISRPEIQQAQQTIPTGIGILSGLRNRPVPIQQVWQQALAVRDRGLGVSFFSFESLWNYAPEPAVERKTRFQTLFYNPARRPTSTVQNVSPPPQDEPEPLPAN